MRRLVSALCCAACLWCCLTLGACSSVAQAESVHIVMSAPADMTEPQTNYYKRWLEEQTELEITLELVDPGYMPEYLHLLFLSGETGIDAVFFAPDDGISAGLLAEYGDAGYILPLDGFVAETPGTNLEHLLDGYADYNLKAVLTAPDGRLYYMPNLDTSTAQLNAQTLWMNSDWLRQAGMTIPLTTEDFALTLRAFQDMNAGLGDDAGVAIAGSSEEDAQFVVHYLMNAFVYTDPQNAYLAVQNNDVFFAPTTEEWRQGLIYCRGLYEEGLLPKSCFTFSSAQFRRLVNDPRDLVGSFTAGSIGEVLSAGSPALSSRFIHIPPLTGPQGVRNATVQTILPTPGGIITSSCQNPQAIFHLMDTMLGEGAYLVAAYGQQGVDWDYAGVGDIGYDGNDALITVKSPEWNVAPNRNFSGNGPFVTALRLADGVAWNGYQADQRFLDARAARVYQDAAPDEYIRALTLEQAEQRSADGISAYVRQMTEQFITGNTDPADDAEWLKYVQQFEELGLDRLLEAARISYEDYGRSDA